MQFAHSGVLTPKRLHQKIAVIGDNVVIGWAGKNYEAAQDVITGLMELHKHQQLDMRLVNEHLDRQPSPVWEQIGVVGFVKGAGRQMAQFGRSYIKLRSSVLGNVGLLGSGEDALARFIETQTRNPSSKDRDVNVVEQAVSYGLTLTGVFLNHEILTQESLGSLYGGGYELATLDGGKFNKVGDVTYVYWTARYDGDQQINLRQVPERAFRYAYDADVLLIRSLDFSETTERVTNRSTLFVVPPVHRYPATTDATNYAAPSMNGTWLCNYILVLTDARPPNVLTLIKYRPQGVSWVRFDEHHDRFEVGVEHDFLLRVAEEIRSNPALRK
jgi:hypothetical protein